ncbi:nitroreductase family protein [Candidatus Pacearchaeota archaeon]|nr:nitroreductase family protein [Candidatus Pacearchaeota archaeon]
MEFDEVIAKRKSIKAFKGKTASWKSVMEAIDAANQAPFADNRNNLKFIIIEDKDKIANIAHLANQTWISKSGIIVLVCSDDTNLENMHGERGRVYARQQAGAAIENLLLKIVDLGLSACWVGSYSDDLIKTKLQIPQNIQIEAIIPIGYAKSTFDKKRRAALENTIYWEEWGRGRRGPMFKEQEDEISAG